MVSQHRPPARRTRRGRPTRSRILDAAAVEFAARGFDGAKVDRIARRAGLNKAMLYYHFRNKAALYRTILEDLFQRLAGTLEAGVQAGTPEARLRRFIALLDAETAAQPHFPAIWLREMAEGGRHLDAGIVSAIARVVVVLSAVLDAGRREGVFGDAHPLVVQMGIVAPLLLFTASAPVRKRFGGAMPVEMSNVARAAVVRHVETATLAALAAGARPRSDRAADGASASRRPVP